MTALERDARAVLGNRATQLGWLVCLALAALRLSPSSLAIVGGLGLLLGTLRVVQGTGVLWGALGFLTVLLPLLGDGVLLACGFFVLSLGSEGGSLPRFARPFLFVVGAHLVGASVTAALTLGSLFGSGLFETLAQLWASAPRLGGAVRGTLHLVLLCGLFSSFQANAAAREVFLRALGWGAATSAGLIAASLLFSSLVGYTTTNEFWRSLGRHPGTFTDPNSFGVSAVLIVALLCELACSARRGAIRAGVCGLIAVWCVLPWVSGSRSFFLGLAALFSLGAWRTAPRLFAALGGLGIIGIGALQLVDISGTGLPVGVARFLSSLQFDRLGETFFSRGIFWTIGGAVAIDHPWFGVGLGAFSMFVEPYARVLGIPLNGWTDNANSYYLGILAELGIVGVLGWFLAVKQLRWGGVSQSPLWPRAGTGALLVMLVVGPHLDFAEVAVLAAVCLAGSVTAYDQERSSGAAREGWFRWCVAGVVFASIVTSYLLRERGLYPFERDDGGRFRWTAPRARILAECRAGVASFSLRAVHPEISPADPVTVRVASVFESVAVQLKETAPYTVKVACSPVGAPVWAVSPRVPLTLVVDRGWVPGGADYRRLGVQLRVTGND
ncbi:MAG: O-Antigen ligase [Pseudomonadota bacterium]|jgi:hypothetical protein